MDTGGRHVPESRICVHQRSLDQRAEGESNEEGDPLGSPSHNSPELVYFSFWTIALKASASL